MEEIRRQTSSGVPGVGTTLIDETTQGTMPGEIVELEAPRTVVYHWWEKSKSGKLKFEGWPSYHLERCGSPVVHVHSGAATS